ncbi:MAG: rhodanese-like domain-containing protein [Marivirga sp.]|nr:rhodanese-like domain-containing protein [Marivirga sp.]
MKKSLLIFLVTISGCSEAQRRESPESIPAQSSTLDPKRFKEKLSTDANVVLLDVRTPEEAEEGIIPGAVVMDFNASDFKAKVAKLDKDKTYLVYCKVGGRSAKAITLMEDKGIKKVYHLDGGYVAWIQSGFETVKPKPDK